jgi:hypothetical protein
LKLNVTPSGEYGKEGERRNEVVKVVEFEEVFESGR